MEFEFNSRFWDLAKVVRRWGYRQALVVERLFTIRFEHGDEVDEFYRGLLKAFNRLDQANHDCYELRVTCPGGEGGPFSVFLQFSDWVCYVGLALREEQW